ncbi:MAG: formate dehydrogenase subunit gamma [Acidobacteria bacterium]|nr:MAG: formate dehydrogenase subunit gamma [Acidobacteriota bacterium]
MSSEAMPLSPASVPAGEIQRYTFQERLCHWFSALTYVYCLLTGLAFYTPYLFWIAVLLGSGATSRFWHPIVGLGFLVSILWMHSLWRRDMTISGKDKQWLDQVNNYATNRDNLVPPQDRFNAGQKLFYWVMFWGTILLLISGLLMWFPEYISFRVAWIRSLAVLTHECAALITIGAFIIHVYMGLFLVPGSGRAMVRGHVPAAWARVHHRLWYDRVAGKPSST